MQAIVPPVGERNPNGHGREAILAALRAETGARRLSFRYHLLNAGGTRLETLDNVTACTITQNWHADIKRTATFSMLDRGGIDFLSDRIQPVVRLHLPPYGPEDYVEWPQGVFLLSTSKRQVNAQGMVTRDPVLGYDQLQIYADDLIDARYSVAAGAGVITEVTTLLDSVIASPDTAVVPHAGTLVVAKEWEPGTSKLRIINDLLGLINYESLSFDENGVARVAPYRTPAERAEEYVYADDRHGLIVPDAGQELDLFSVPNRWVLVVSEPDQPVMVATYVNNDPGSLTSTVARQRVITDHRVEQEATDQGILDLKVARLAFEASQVYESIPFSTAIMPIHSGNDVYRLTMRGLAVNAVYSEQSWKMTLERGARMEHVARRVVSV